MIRHPDTFHADPPAGSDLDLRLARPWPDGVPADDTSPNAEGLCDCCFWTMDGDKIWWNGGFAHARCAAEHELLILGEDAMPGLLDHLDYLDDLHVFLTRLDQEATALGINRQLLATAVERACHG